MKTTRIKVLFIILLFSAAVPSEMQASAESSCNFLKKNPIVVAAIVGCGLGYLAWKCFEKMEKRAYRRIQQVLEKGEDDGRRELLTKVDAQELFSDPSSNNEYYLTSLKPELVQEVRDALKSLDIPNSLVEKMLILGSTKHRTDCSRDRDMGNTVSVHFRSNYVPYAVLIDTEFLVEATPFCKKFSFLHEGGHVKAFCTGVYGDEELNELIADTYALDVFVRQGKKDQLRDLSHDRFMITRKRPYLSAQELVYHGEKIFDIQQKGGKLNVLSYARKIITDRKEDSYEQKIMEKTGGYFGLSNCPREEVGYLEKVAVDYGRQILAKVNAKELLNYEDLILPKKVGKTELSHDSLRQYYLTFLKPELKQEVSDALKFVNSSDFWVEKIPILGINYVDSSERRKRDIGGVLAFGYGLNMIPYAILIDTELLSQSSPSARRLNFLGKGWDVKGVYLGLHGSGNELREVASDICGLDYLISQSVVLNPSMMEIIIGNHERPKPYLTGKWETVLSPEELIYHGKEISDIQERGGKLDSLAYARKVIAARKKDGYKEEMIQKIKMSRLLDLSDGTRAVIRDGNDREAIMDFS